MTQPWFNPNYLIRRGIQIISPDGAPAGHPVNYNLADATKSLQMGFADVMVIYKSADATPNYQVLPTLVTPNGSGGLLVQFALVNDILPNQPDPGYYYVYETNFNIGTTVITPTYTPVSWPIQNQIYSPSITFLKPNIYWNNGVSNVNGAIATISFYGTAIQVLSNYGPNQGILQLTLDNTTPQVIDLYSSVVTNAAIYTNLSLDGSFHNIQIIATGQSNPASIGTEINITGFNLVKYLNVVDLGEEVYSIIWSSIAFGGT